MTRVINDLLLALSYFTRLPVDRWVNYEAAALDRATGWFPLAGWLVGLAGAGTLYLADLWLPLEVAVLLGMAVMVLATGAFHEDGLADTSDGFGPVGDRDKALAVMKDSRLGTYGALGLIFVLALKFLALVSLADGSLAAMALLAAQPLSRLMSVGLIPVLPQVSGAGSHTRAVARRVAWTSLVTALVIAAPAAWLIPAAWLPALAAAITITALFALACRARFGGYTGDILGANQQLTEAAILVACLAVYPTP